MSSSVFTICVVVVFYYTARVSGANTSGFPSLEQLGNDGVIVGPNVRQWVFLAIRFTCDGYVTKWIFRARNETIAGGIDDSDRPPFLPLMEIWRETDTILGPSNEYLLINTTGSLEELQGSGPVYEYVLQLPVEVQENDTFGIRTLYHDETDGTWILRLEMLEVAAGTAPTSFFTSISGLIFDTDFLTTPNNDFIPLVTAVISIPGSTSSSLVLVPTVTAAVPSSIPGSTSSSLVLVPTVTATVPSNVAASSSSATPPSASASITPVPTTSSVSASVTISVPTPSPSFMSSSDDDSSLRSTVLYVAVGTAGVLLGALSFLMLVAVIVVCVKRKQNATHCSTFEMMGNEAYIVTEGMREDTTCNEAYGTVATEDHNTIPLSENEVYAIASDLELSGDVITSQNQAYGSAAADQPPVIYDYVQ